MRNRGPRARFPASERVGSDTSGAALSQGRCRATKLSAPNIASAWLVAQGLGQFYVRSALGLIGDPGEVEGRSNSRLGRPMSQAELKLWTTV